MSKTTKSIRDIVWYIVVFLLIQIIVNYAVNTVSLLVNGMPFGTALTYAGTHPVIDSTNITIASALSSLLTIALFAWRKWTPVSPTYLRSRPWSTLLWVAVLGFGTILPSIWLLEQLQIEVPDNVERMLTALLGYRWGYLALGLLGPIAEETVFRGAILRLLLKLAPHRTHWLPIALSALIFALAHGNRAQLPYAFLMGLLLGWMYVRTDSLVPGIVLHWINNSIVFAMYNLIPNSANAKLSDLFGGNQTAVWMSLFFSLCILLPALFQLTLRLKKADDNR